MASYKKVDLDLRTISRKNGFTDVQLWQVQEMMAKRGLELEVREDVKGNERPYVIKGQTQVGDSQYQLLDNDLQLKSYISKIRKIDKNIERINKWRAKEEVEYYEPIHISHLVRLSSSKREGLTGIDNYLETQTKILARDKDGLNKIQSAGERLRDLQELKYESFEEPREIMKTLAPEINQTEYFNKDGEFLSKKKGKQFKELFSEVVIDKYEDYKEDSDHESYFKWLGNNYDTETLDYKNKTREEKKQLYQEYAREQAEHRKKYYEITGKIDKAKFEYEIHELDTILSKIKEKEKK